MEGSVIDLSRYRLEKAKEDLETAEENMIGGKYRASINRSYYAVFHALRAVTALDRLIQESTAGSLLSSISIMSKRRFLIRKSPR